ncbi:ankyrin repeat-containing domain protein [Aspergillus pseudoustus]|uniref:Ankyrin repeat-containing domain protein n=1 Tax=Aspergillus pseudoustus TaxID=1810923 RepID=A0ABR4IZJ8_9EURO
MPQICYKKVDFEKNESLLLSLPDELILLIGEELSCRSLGALIRASRRLYFTLRASIYTVALRGHDPRFNVQDALKFSARTGNLSTIKNFLACIDPKDNLIRLDWLPILIGAAKHGHDHVLRFSLDLYTDHVAQYLGRLMWEAATGSHVKTVEALIDAGLDISEPRDLFYCPLSQAAMAYQGDPRTVQLLSDRGAYKFASDEDEEIALHGLARIGCFDMIQFFLDLGSPIDAQNIDGNTPLLMAIEAQHHSAVLLLLSRGASVTIRDGAGFNALHKASSQRATSAASIVQLLLDHGADPNERSGTNKTPLHLATRDHGGDRDIIKVLLAAGADCCAIVDENDRTTPLQNVMSSGYRQHPNIALLMEAGAAANPLQDSQAMIVLAIRHGLFDFARKLIDSCLDPKEMPIFLAKRPLIEAAHPGLEEILKYLLTRVKNVNWKTPISDTALITAAASGAGSETIRLLLLQNAHADAKDRNECVALMHAARLNTAEVTAMILEATAQPQVTDSRGQTALHHAIEGQKEDTVDLLLKHGFSPFESADGLTPIGLALHRGNPAIVQSLLKYSVDPEIKSTQGDTALIQACKQGHHAVAEVLLNAGADPNAETQHANNSYPHARTALCIACYKGNANLVRILLTHGANVHGAPQPGQTPLGIAATRGHAEILCLLLAHGAGVNSITGPPHLHYTALLNASRACHSRIVELLLAHGASISHADYYGHTALSHAATCGDVGTIQALVAAGAEVDAPDYKGRTPLSWAVTESHPEAAQTLIQAGADVTRSDKAGLTPISLAMRNRDDNIIRVLYQQ